MADIAKYVELTGHGRVIEVEESIVPVIAEMIRAGIDVVSVERKPAGWFEIELGMPGDIVALLNAIARYVPEGDPFWKRMGGADGDARSWKYAVRPAVDMQMGAADERLNWRPPTRFRLQVAIRCPQEDLAIVTELLRDFNGR